MITFSTYQLIESHKKKPTATSTEGTAEGLYSLALFIQPITYISCFTQADLEVGAIFFKTEFSVICVFSFVKEKYKFFNLKKKVKKLIPCCDQGFTKSIF